jgi:hypothetical protein
MKIGLDGAKQLAAIGANLEIHSDLGLEGLKELIAICASKGTHLRVSASALGLEGAKQLAAIGRHHVTLIVE